eukprot:1593834-Amphidinium_carterae.1
MHTKHVLHGRPAQVRKKHDRSTTHTLPLHTLVSSTALTSHGSRADRAKRTSRTNANYIIKFSRTTYLYTASTADLGTNPDHDSLLTQGLCPQEQTTPIYDDSFNNHEFDKQNFSKTRS